MKGRKVYLQRAAVLKVRSHQQKGIMGRMNQIKRKLKNALTHPDGNLNVAMEARQQKSLTSGEIICKKTTNRNT